MGTKRETAVEEIDTEVGFERVRLADVADVVRGVTYKKDDATEKPTKGLIPILRANNIQEGTLELEGELVYVPRDLVSDQQVLRKGDIVIATSSGSKDLVGKAAPMREDWHGSFGAFCAVVRPRKEIHPLYLVHFLGSPEYKDLIRDKALGVNINNLRRGDLEELQIPLAPLPEQRRIVSAIETQLGRLDAAVARLHTAKAKLKRYKQAVLKAAFSEEDWPIHTTSDVTELITDGDHQAPPQVSDGIPFIVISNVKNNAVDFTATKYVPESYYAQITEKRKPRRGDVLYTVTGSYGIPALVDHDEPFCFQRHIALLRPNALVLATYLFSWLQTPEAMAQAKQYATGTAQMTVSLKGLRSFELPVPPIKDQKRIVREVEERLDSIAEMEATLDAQLLQSTRLRQAVLKRAFEGKLI